MTDGFHVLQAILIGVQMMYSEAAYFEGNHCQHVADYYDKKWRDRKKKELSRLNR